MAPASIPVDLLNPGQVFACLGFLEAADVLLGDAEAGFDWNDETRTAFVMQASGAENPFAVVLRFLAEAELRRCAPTGYLDPEANADDEEDAAVADGMRLSDFFPDRRGDRMALPIRLQHPDHAAIDIGHWADGSSRNSFKLYAGNRSAHSIARAMLRGTQEKPKKRQGVTEVRTRGVDTLMREHREDLTARPFDVITQASGSFNFDPRGAWTALDAGYSPNEHSDHWTQISPVVEFLAAWGLEHARPMEYELRQCRYGVWGGLLSPILARPALAGIQIAAPVRTYLFRLDLSGKNKVVTFARRETNI